MTRHATKLPRRQCAPHRKQADLTCELLELRLPPAGHTIPTAGTVALGPLDMTTVSGFLSSSNQVDVYQVSLGTGDQLTAAVVAQTAGSGLQSAVRVFDAHGQQVAADEQEGGDPGLTFQAPSAADYFVAVSSAGNTGYDPNSGAAETGGTTKGTYALALSVFFGQPLEQNLAGSSFRLAESTAAWGDVIHPSVTVENRGGAMSGSFSVQVYVSPNGLIGTGSSLPLLATPIAVGPLDPGAEWSSSGLALTLPSLAAATAAGLPMSGPVAIGIQIVPDVSSADSGTDDKSGVHRGEDWEGLTVVTPVPTPVADLSLADPNLNTRVDGTYAAAPVPYSITVGPTTGGGQLTAQVQTVSGGAVPRLALYGGTGGQTLLETSDATTADPVATLTQYVSPGTYVLSVTGGGSGTFQLTTTMTAALDPSQPLPTATETGVQPVAVAVGDFTNNGRLDLAVANEGYTSGDPTIQILLGNGDGTFSTGQPIPDSAAPQAIAVADLNGDGKPDLVATNYDGTVGAFLGNGDGTFGSEMTTTVGAAPKGLAVADLTGNGIPDVVVANSGSDTVEVLLGNGQGAFPTALTYNVGGAPTGVAVADLNGDRIPDIVVADAGSATVSGDVEVLFGNRDGTFRAGPVRPDPLGPEYVAVADLNGDGRPDIVVADTGYNPNVPGDAVGVFLNLGGGQFGPQVTTPVGREQYGLAVADLNGDGTPDLVYSNFYDDTVGVLLNNGNGTFTPQTTYTLPYKPAGIVVADLTGNGTPDIVATDLGYGSSLQPSNTLNVLLGNGDGTFQGPSITPAGNGPVALAVQDFNRDGHLDVAATDVEQGQITIELGNGDGTFTPQTPIAVGSRPIAIVAADLNNDGNQDLVVANYGTGTVRGTVEVLLGNGDGTFRTTSQGPITVGVGPGALAVADLGNGHMDIVVANSGDDTIEVLLGNGDGTFRVGQIFRIGHGTPTGTAGTGATFSPVSLQLANLTGNRLLDLVVTDQLDDSIDVFLGNGDGTFRAGQSLLVPYEPGALQLADVTGDKKYDIVVANLGADTVGVLRGNGDGTFQPEQVFPVGALPLAVAVEDVNGDGIPDIVVANTNANTVSVLLGEGGGEFQLQRTFATGQEPFALAVFDANGDGKDDIVTGNYADNTITALLGTGDGTFAPATPANTVADTNTPQSVDPNGDTVVLDASGDILYRQAQGNGLFAPPVILNPGAPARDVVALKTPSGGWAVAAADTSTDPAASSSATPYTVSVYTLGGPIARSAPLTTFDTVGGTIDLATGTGSVTRRIAFSTPSLPTRIAAGNLTGDELDDLVVSDAENDTIQVAFQQPNGSFLLALTLPTGTAPSDVALTDVNGDGRLDVVVTDQSSGDVDIFLNDADHSFSTSERLRAGTGPGIVETTSTITTVAGDHFLPFFGDGGPATDAQLFFPRGVAVDPNGDLFIADAYNNVIREVAAGTGIITNFAGTGVAGYSGDGQAATAAELSFPSGVAVDAYGDVFIADTDNDVIREVLAGSDTIETVAGVGFPYYYGDGGPATDAYLDLPEAVAVDAAGDLFIADTGNNAIREVTGGIINTLPGTAGQLDQPFGVAVDASGDVFIADTGASAVQEVTDGTLTTIAQLPAPTGVAVDQAGDLFVTDTADNQVFEFAAGTGSVTTIAGNGTRGFSGDSGLATAAELNGPAGVAADANGDVYIADTDNFAVRKVAAGTGTITTVAGTGVSGYSGDGGPATTAQLFTPTAVTVDTNGDLFIADTGNNVVREVAAGTGIITTVAGTGLTFGNSGDGGPATAAQLFYPTGVALGADGTLYFADSENDAVRAVTDGTITTVAQIPEPTGIDGPTGVAVDAHGDLFVADTINNEILEVAAGTGAIRVFAGTGVAGFSGDDGPATDAELNAPVGVAVDQAGDVFIADTNNNVVREVAAGTGTITTVAGVGGGENYNGGPIEYALDLVQAVVEGYGPIIPAYYFAGGSDSGDGGPATDAQLNGPIGVAVDAAGDLFIADSFNNVVREVGAATGIITTVAGNNSAGGGYSGDGGPATNAQLLFPYGVAVDSSGDLEIADFGNNVVRKVTAPQAAVASATQPVGLAVGDFTGDGNDDILTVDRGTNTITVLPGNGTGGFGNPQTALTTPTSDGLLVNGDPGPVVAGDFYTADASVDGHRAGKEDIAILMEGTDQVWIFTNNGHGTFTHTSSISVETGATGLSITSGSAPGLYNLLVGDKFGDVLTLVGTGDGTFVPVTLTGDSAPIAVQTVSGTPEAIVADQQTNLVNVQTPQKSGAFAPVPVVVNGTSTTALAPADTTTQLAPGYVVWAFLDQGSTLKDAIVIASGSNSVLIYRTISDVDGQHVFADPVSYSVGTDPVSVTVADINGDGIPDLLVANEGSNDVSVLFGGYDPNGYWVGTTGPRLKSDGGPVAANLVADAASPGGYDLAITNANGTIDILPGRGQGYFDDRNPQVVALGAPVAQPPTFMAGSEIGYVVTTGGALLRFDLADPTAPATTVTAGGVQAAAVMNGQIFEALSDGGVEVLTPGVAGGQALVQLSTNDGLLEDPSALTVFEGPSGPEALVTSAGSDTIYAFTRGGFPPPPPEGARR